MQVLFIQGPIKTATSTLTGILNCHPGIFILFETYLGQPFITKYGNQLLDRYPGARYFFRTENDYGVPVAGFFEYLRKEEPDFEYKYVGTKINSLDPSVTQKGKNHKILFTKRDFRTWLIKESVIKRYRTDLDIVIPSMEYLRYIVKSARYEHAYHVWMENLVEENDQTIDNISDYLDLKLKPYTEKWWNKIGLKDKKDPKSAFRFAHNHLSSNEKPEHVDTEYRLRDHMFWRETDKIFNKYYRISDYSVFNREEISEDLKHIDKLKKFAPMPYKEAYSEVKSKRFGFVRPQVVRYSPDENKQSLILKIAKKIKRAMEIIIDNQNLSRSIAYGIIFYDEIQLIAKILSMN